MSSLSKTQLASNPADLLDAALDYAARGWSIIPTIGKRAAGLWKPFQERPADEPTLRRMFSRKGITGLAVIFGSASGGLACRDYDDADAYRRLAADHPDLAALLPTVQTARGYHVYFRGPDGFTKFPDGEYRGDARHYCLVPPSLHPSGSTYRWLIPLPEGELPTVDPVQVGLLTHTQADTHATQATHATQLHVSSDAVETAIRATLPSGPGQRNRQLFDFARRLKGIKPDATIDELEAIVRQWHSRALPFITTKDWLTTWIDFRVASARVKRPAGATMSEIVATAAARTPADASAIAKLMALCEALQEHHGPGKAWPLSCRMAANEIGTSHTTAWAMLKLLVIEGTIELVTPGGKKGSLIAATYRYTGEQS
jgi:Bifunctional DNA primase/polymerase, N-terminal